MSTDTQQKDTLLSWNLRSDDNKNESKMTLGTLKETSRQHVRKSHWKPRVITEKVITDD